MKPNNDFVEPPNNWCRSCNFQFIGEREFCPHCGKRLKKGGCGRSAAIGALGCIGAMFACVGACSVYVVATATKEDETYLMIPIVIGGAAALLAAVLIYAAIAIYRKK